MSKKLDLVLKGKTREERFVEIVVYLDAKFEGKWPYPSAALALLKEHRKSPPTKRAASVAAKNK